MRVYVLADGHCLVENCELGPGVVHIAPSATMHALDVCDENGCLTGMGLKTGAWHTKKGDAINFHMAGLGNHWLAHHMRRGYGLILPCIVADQSRRGC